jgi:hypothetical protein
MKKQIVKAPNDRCLEPEEEEGAGRIFRVFKKFPSDMVPGAPGYSVGRYFSQQQCTENYRQYAKFINWEVLNFCSSAEETVLDSLVVGCDADRMVGRNYQSQDGSCSGPYTKFTWSRSDSCFAKNDFRVPSFENFICM